MDITSPAPIAAQGTSIDSKPVASVCADHDQDEERIP
jgi:hypothetical protein